MGQFLRRVTVFFDKLLSVRQRSDSAVFDGVPDPVSDSRRPEALWLCRSQGVSALTSWMFSSLLMQSAPSSELSGSKPLATSRRQMQKPTLDCWSLTTPRQLQTPPHTPPVQRIASQPVEARTSHPVQGTITAARTATPAGQADTRSPVAETTTDSRAPPRTVQNRLLPVLIPVGLSVIVACYLFGFFSALSAALGISSTGLPSLYQSTGLLRNITPVTPFTNDSLSRRIHNQYNAHRSYMNAGHNNSYYPAARSYSEDPQILVLYEYLAADKGSWYSQLNHNLISFMRLRGALDLWSPCFT